MRNVNLKRLIMDTLVPLFLGGITIDGYRRTIGSDKILESKFAEQNQKIDKNFQEQREVVKSVKEDVLNFLEKHNIHLEKNPNYGTPKMDLNLENSNNPKKSILDEISNSQLKFKNPISAEDQNKLLEIQEKIQSLDKQKEFLEEEIKKYEKIKENQLENTQQNPNQIEFEIDLEDIAKKIENYNEALASLTESRQLEIKQVLNILASSKDPGSIVVESSSEIVKSEIPMNILDLISKYQDFLTTLDLDQIVALFNLGGYGTILVFVFTIHSTFISNKVLEKFNLEQKYPRLNKFLQIRKSLANKYLKFYIGLLYFYIIIFILGNFFMLILKIFS